MADLLAKLTTFGLSLGLLVIALVGLAMVLSSTALLGNALAGVALRLLRTCRVGDYVRAANDNGRITGMHALHVVITTANGDRTLLPNLSVITQPFTVLRGEPVPDAPPAASTVPQQVSQPVPQQAPQAPSDPVPDNQVAAPPQPTVEQSQRAAKLRELKHAYTEMSQQLLKLEQALKEAGQGEERRPLSLEKKKLEAAMARTAREIDMEEAAG